jgi:uncharacterized protein
MVRLLVLIVLVVLAVWLVRRALRGAERRQPPPSVKEGELIACAHCGVHLPRSEARQSEGALYCSEEHARLGKR